jgi:hypothetical protein
VCKSGTQGDSNLRTLNIAKENLSRGQQFSHHSPSRHEKKVAQSWTTYYIMRALKWKCLWEIEDNSNNNNNNNKCRI